ncbi:hypothetical protein CRG98_018717 [Punica granatum]|uniref:Uncharacterized protein n=1 Tax=Punica granatum TaxID=22663 RepID=A0A2I0JXA5_PUNGR|nr:hypothetical protein CRG98_018717 [Punica granatum]
MAPDKKKGTEWGSCTVVGISDRDHLFTRESEGCEERFERDDTTRQGKRRGVGAAGLGGFSRGLGRLGRGLGSSSGCGFESWLRGLAWLSCGSHSIRREAGRSSRLDWLYGAFRGPIN